MRSTSNISATNSRQRGTGVSRKALALLLLLTLASSACSSGDADVTAGEQAGGESSVSTSSTITTDAPATTPTTTEVVSGESETISPTTVVADVQGDLVVGDDGWYPWIFPSPTLSWYEEGCVSPEVVVVNFMSNFLNDPDPMLTPLGASANPDERRILVHSRGEGGTPMETGTVLTLARVELEIVDCAAWVILSADSENVMVDQLAVSAPADSDSVVIDVAGVGSGFEALISIRAHDESFRLVADGFAMGGSFEVQPFAGRALFTSDVIDSNVMVIATSSTVADGAIPQFSAHKVMVPEALCCDGLAAEGEEPYDVGPALAVVGVAFDDVLNVRSGPGVEHEIVATLAPFSVGVPVRNYALIDGWIYIEDPSTGTEGWVNRRFTTAVLNSDDPELWHAISQVREALSSPEPGARLADVLADQGSPSITISPDAFFGDEEQVITTAALEATGSNADTDRLWGYTDGEGSPIESTIEEYLSGFSDVLALSDPDELAVDFRLKESNTTDNMGDRFPGVSIVELHHAGGTGESADFTWGTVRLGFEPNDSGYRLVAIAGDSWTI